MSDNPLARTDDMPTGRALAKTLLASGMLPRGLDSEPKVLIAMTTVSDLGLPASAIADVAVIGNRPCLSVNLMLSLVLQSNVLEVFDEGVTGDGDTLTAWVLVKRRNVEPARKFTFSVDDAKRARLWGKEGPWTLYPGRMLAARARSIALRTLFADLLKGVGITEELRDAPRREREAPETPVKDLGFISAADGKAPVAGASTEAAALPAKEIPTPASAPVPAETTKPRDSYPTAKEREQCKQRVVSAFGHDVADAKRAAEWLKAKISEFWPMMPTPDTKALTWGDWDRLFAALPANQDTEK